MICKVGTLRKEDFCFAISLNTRIEITIPTETSHHHCLIIGIVKCKTWLLLLFNNQITRGSANLGGAKSIWTFLPGIVNLVTFLTSLVAGLKIPSVSMRKPIVYTPMYISWDSVKLQCISCVHKRKLLDTVCSIGTALGVYEAPWRIQLTHAQPLASCLYADTRAIKPTLKSYRSMLGQCVIVSERGTLLFIGLTE